MYNSTFMYLPIFYQGLTYSYEALPKFNSNEHGSVNEFTDLDSDCVEFDLKSISEIIQTRRRFLTKNKMNVSINIVAKSLESDYFLTKCEKLLAIENNIIFEIKGIELLANVEKITMAINRLHRLGANFTLDGCCMSLMVREDIIQINFDYIKLDASLVKNIHNSYIAFMLIKEVYNLLTNVFNHKVIFDGVENEKQYNLLNSLGSVRLQGNHFGIPLRIEDLNRTALIHDAAPFSTLQLSHQFDMCMYKLNMATDDLEISTGLTCLQSIDTHNLLGIHNSTNNIRELQRIANENVNNMIMNFKSVSDFLLSSLLNNSEAFVIIRDANGIAIFNNKKHQKYLNLDIVGMPISSVIELFPDYKHCLELDQKLFNSQQNYLVSNEGVKDDEVELTFEAHRERIVFSNAEFIMCTVYELKRKYKLEFDILTHCYNRSYLQVDNVYDFNSLIFIDLDGFKSINDIHGHSRGDLALVEVVNIFNSKLRDRDVLIRFGGDEFIILVKSDNFESLTQRLLDIRLILENVFAEKDIFLSYSFGIAAIEMDINEALKKADKAMYKYKNIRKKTIMSQI